MNRRAVRVSDREGLGELLASPAPARPELHFALHGDGPERVRALLRHSGLSMSSLDRELRRREQRGLVERVQEGGRMLYRAAASHSGWKAMRRLIRAGAFIHVYIKIRFATLNSRREDRAAQADDKARASTPMRGFSRL